MQRQRESPVRGVAKMDTLFSANSVTVIPDSCVEQQLNSIAAQRGNSTPSRRPTGEARPQLDSSALVQRFWSPSVSAPAREMQSAVFSLCWRGKAHSLGQREADSSVACVRVLFRNGCWALSLNLSPVSPPGGLLNRLSSLSRLMAYITVTTITPPFYFLFNASLF